MLIVGGGIAGLTMFQFLQNRGHQVTLVEKADKLRADGAGIMLGINAMKVMGILGLSDEVLSKGAPGAPLKEFSMTDSRGTMLGKVESRYLQNETGYATVGIHRAALHEILTDNLTSANVKLCTSVKQITTNLEKNDVVFSDGDEQTYDLIIAADGIYSNTRDLRNITSALRYSGYTCWRLVVDVSEKFSVDSGFEMWGRAKRFGIVPIGKNKIFCFATCNAQANEENYKYLSVEAFKHLFAEFGGLAQKILSLLSEEHELIHSDLYNQQNICMTYGNIVFVGDSAHAAIPNMGHGAGMAIEDAYVLNQLLISTDSVTEALKEYNLMRSPRVQLIRDKSYTLGKVAQWNSYLAIMLRNYMLKLLPSQVLTKSQKIFLLDF